MNSYITGVTLKGRLILLDTRYVITSNSPSGGMKVIDRSRSNRPSLTHWWNLISSIWIPFCCYSPCWAAFWDSLMSNLSFIPNLHSGIPDNCVFITTCPITSDFRTVPLFDKSTLIFSIISINSSLYLYLIFSALHEIDPVA